MSTYIIKHSSYSGIVMNINDIVLSNDPIVSFTQQGDDVAMTHSTSIMAFYYPYIAIADADEEKVFIYKITSDGCVLDSTISSPVKGIDFGYSISIKDKVLAIGAPGYNDNTGIVYVYFLMNNEWSSSPNHTINIVSNGDLTKLGSTVHVSEHYIMASAPGKKDNNSIVGSVELFYYNYVIDIYELEHTFFSNQPNLSNNFGSTIDMIGDDMIFISSPNGSVTSGTTKDSAGFVEIFVKGSNGWTYDSTLTSTTPAASGNFGSSISAQIGRTIIGEPGSNSVHVFDYHSPNWNILESFSFQTSGDFVDSTVKSTDLQGESVAQSVSERIVLWGAPDNNVSGCVYVIETTPAGNWVPSITYKLSKNTSTSDKFGQSILFNGEFLVVNQPGSGNGSISIYKK